MIVRFFFLSLLWIAVVGSAMAQSPRLDAQLSRQRVAVGEQVDLRVKVMSAKGAKVVFPDYGRQPLAEGLELLEASKVDTLSTTNAQAQLLSRTYHLMAFDSLRISLPLIAVEVNGSKVQDNKKLELEVYIPPVDTTKADNLRPTHAPVVATWSWSPHILLWAWLAVGLLLLLIALLMRLSVRKPPMRKVKVVPPPAPELTASAAITATMESAMADDAAQKDFYIALTDALRHYLEERYGFEAMEMTSAEIMATLAQQEGSVPTEIVRPVLDTADLVKFARYESTQVERSRSAQQTRAFVEATRLPANQLPQPEIRLVEVEEQVKRRWSLFYRCLAWMLGALTLALSAYTYYLLWLNFA